MGSLLDQNGYKAVPSLNIPYPCCSYCIRQNKGGTCRGRRCMCTPLSKSDACDDELGPCAFFWGANDPAMYGGGRTCKQLGKYRHFVAATQLETPVSVRQDGATIQNYASAFWQALLQTLPSTFTATRPAPNGTKTSEIFVESDQFLMH